MIKEYHNSCRYVGIICSLLQQKTNKQTEIDKDKTNHSALMWGILHIISGTLQYDCDWVANHV